MRRAPKGVQKVSEEIKTATWPPASIEGLARELHEQDRTEGESTGEWTGKDWDDLSAETRDGFMAKAVGAIHSGEFILGEGWSAETHG